MIRVLQIKHCVKSVRIKSYSGPHFLAFGLNTKRYTVSLRIQFQCGKIRTRITPNTDTFYAVKVMLRKKHRHDRTIYFTRRKTVMQGHQSWRRWESEHRPKLQWKPPVSIFLCLFNKKFLSRCLEQNAGGERLRTLE